MSTRMDKIDRQLQKVLTEIIQKEVDDPVFDFFSITRVHTTRDLQESKIYFSLLADDKYEQALKTLKKMKGFIRSRLAEKIHLRILPKLSFFSDESIKYSVDIYTKIENIQGEYADRDDKKDNR